MEKNNIDITIMTNEDLLLIKDILYTEFDDFWSYQTLYKELNSSNTTYIVAKEDSIIVGFAGILIIIDEANIMNIVTKKDKRNLGIGTLLLNKLISICQKQNLSSITLEVNENNKSAINLYKKLNFDQVGLRKKYYNNADSAILMTLYL